MFHTCVLGISVTRVASVTAERQKYEFAKRNASAAEVSRKEDSGPWRIAQSSHKTVSRGEVRRSRTIRGNQPVPRYSNSVVPTVTRPTGWSSGALRRRACAFIIRAAYSRESSGQKSFVHIKLHWTFMSRDKSDAEPRPSVDRSRE